MHAMIFDHAHTPLRLDSNMPVPQPGPDQVLIKIHACGVGICNAFETYGFGGVGDLGFTMIWAQTQSEFLSCVEVGCVTDFESKHWDDLLTRFCFERFQVYIVHEFGCA